MSARLLVLANAAVGPPALPFLCSYTFTVRTKLLSRAPPGYFVRNVPVTLPSHHRKKYFTVSRSSTAHRVGAGLRPFDGNSDTPSRLPKPLVFIPLESFTFILPSSFSSSSLFPKPASFSAHFQLPLTANANCRKGGVISKSRSLCGGNPAIETTQTATSTHET